MRANHGCCGTISGPRVRRPHARCAPKHARGAWLGASSPVREARGVATAAPQSYPCAPRLCGATGTGSRSRRRKAVSMRSSGKAESASPGTALSHAVARCPDCERRVAGHREGRQQLGLESGLRVSGRFCVYGFWVQGFLVF